MFHAFTTGKAGGVAENVTCFAEVAGVFVYALETIIVT